MDSHQVEIIPNNALQTAKESREAKLAEFEVRRVARSLAIPSLDNDVQQALRARSQPVCYFGEDAHDRRERLRGLMAAEVIEANAKLKSTTVNTEYPNPTDDSTNIQQQQQQQLQQPQVQQEQENEIEKEKTENKEEKQVEEFFTEGNQQLKSLRKALAIPSLKRARARLIHEHHVIENAQLRLKARQKEEDIVNGVRNARIIASHVAGDRPLSAIAYAGAMNNTGSDIVATGSWGGTIKLWSGDMCGTVTQTIDAHDGRVSMLRLNQVSGNPEDLWLLTCGTDGIARAYKRSNNDNMIIGEEEHKAESKLQDFKEQIHINAHGGNRICDVNMHPFRQSLMATAGFDGKFSLHDEGVTILQQETGHERVYRVGFHPDGSLLASCGLDGGIRVWDLRSGRAIMTMTKAHADNVLGLEFHHDGRSLASCGADNVVRIWDLRSVKCVKTIAAHRKLVSGMKFGGEGDVLVTCSFDATVKCWGGKRNWGLLNAHTGFEDKVTAIDCSEDAEVVVTASYEKTWKLIAKDE